MNWGISCKFAWHFVSDHKPGDLQNSSPNKQTTYSIVLVRHNLLNFMEKTCIDIRVGHKNCFSMHRGSAFEFLFDVGRLGLLIILSAVVNYFESPNLSMGLTSI